MKELAIVALLAIVLVSACVLPTLPTQQPSTPSSASTSPAGQQDSGLADLPSGSQSQDTGLAGQNVDLGPLM
jgi:hypothetical protein